MTQKLHLHVFGARVIENKCLTQKLMNRTESNRNDRAHATVAVVIDSVGGYAFTSHRFDTARAAVVLRLARPSDRRWRQRHTATAAAGASAAPARLRPCVAHIVCHTIFEPYGMQRETNDVDAQFSPVENALCFMDARLNILE
ncbi:hypothetical protein ABMA28_006776 [Loxostege sticticalis]|uniref:Uncharacterized protein n=1 Tax=Loxostege sticticalis TaxID=481309 RepID=A0ABD0TNJ3_LOXSC